MGLVLLPTRELAIQVEETIHKIGSVYGMRTAVLIGGAPMFPQLKSLRSKPNIIVATPGRLIDHLEQRNLSLANVKVLVLDEADRMLDMGFEQQIKIILDKVPKERQTMLFCATMPSKISQIAEKYMKKPLHIEVAPAGTANESVEQEIFIIHKEDKLRLLAKLLDEYKGMILIFTRTKRGAKKISDAINKMDHSASDIHSDKSLGQRRAALGGFKSGKIRILVATDIASRGIDVSNIELVINYDLPEQTEDYVHRIGRTGRAGKTGKAISFATPEQKHDIRIIEKLIRTRINVSPLPELPERSTLPKLEHISDDRGFGRGGNSRGGDRGRDRGRGRDGGKRFGDRDRKSFSGDRKRERFGRDERRTPIVEFDNQKKPFEDKNISEKSFNNFEKPNDNFPRSDRRKTFSGDRPPSRFGRDERRKPIGSDRERKPFGERKFSDKPFKSSERSNDNFPRSDRRKSFSGDRPPSRFGRDERRKPIDSDRERKPFGERKFSDRQFKSSEKSNDSFPRTDRRKSFSGDRKPERDSKPFATGEKPRWQFPNKTKSKTSRPPSKGFRSRRDS